MKILICVLGIIIAISLTGCVEDKNTNKNEPNTNATPLDIVSKDTAIEDVKSPSKVNLGDKKSTIIIEFDKILKKEGGVTKAGIFFKENINSLTEYEAEYFIEKIVLYQSKIISEMNGKLYKTEYINALNKTMDGNLDKNKVVNIANEQVKKDYQNLIDGMLTIVRYEETPAVETSWEDINSYGKHFSEKFRTMTTLYDKAQNHRYSRLKLDVNNISKDALLIETLVKGEDPSFITWNLNKIYTKLVSVMLVGPEGSYMDVFVKKNDEFYRELIVISKENQNSSLGELITKLDKQFTKYSNNNINEIINIALIKHLDTGYELNYAISKDIMEKVLEFKFDNNKPMQDKLNNAIKTVKSNMQQNIETKSETKFYNNISFANKTYTNINFTINYKDEKSNLKTENKSLIFDFEAGEFIEANKLFGKSKDETIKILENITGEQFKTLPSISIEYYGLSLKYKQENKTHPDYYQINYFNLIDIIDINKFY